MAIVPLPEKPCVRCKLDYSRSDGFKAGGRFYLEYSGSAPSGADCTALGTLIGQAWNTHLAAAATTNWQLNFVDVIDIATTSGAGATVSTSFVGTNPGQFLPSQDAFNVEFGIARRYRGGKPRMYFPPESAAELANDSEWTPGAVTAFKSDVAAFFGQITAGNIGAMGTLTHVNVSYYHGFTVITDSSGRSHNVPTYRPVAKVDPIISYNPKANISSQRRRTIATAF